MKKFMALHLPPKSSSVLHSKAFAQTGRNFLGIGRLPRRIRERLATSVPTSRANPALVRNLVRILFSRSFAAKYFFSLSSRISSTCCCTLRRSRRRIPRVSFPSIFKMRYLLNKLEFTCSKFNPQAYRNADSFWNPISTNSP